MQIHSAFVAGTLAGSILACVPGCDGEEGAPSAEEGAISQEARAEAQQIFTTRCVPCHGAEGGGNGPAAAGLSPPPRDFRLEDWQESVTDDHIERIVVYGGAAVGKAPTMPANPDLQAKPEVVDALRAYVRNLGE